MRLVTVVFGLTACATGGPAARGGDDQSGGTDSGVDAPGGHGHPDAAAPGVTAKLLLSEVALAPGGHEFIEIVNPSATQTVDLSTYYLSDNGNYFKLPAGVPPAASADFIVKFPGGATITPHGVVTVALDTTANFSAAYGTTPTYSIGDGSMTTIVSQAPTLTDAGELIVLFQWDGASELVKDVDILLAGVPTAANGFVAKSGYAMGATSYHADADSMPMQASAAASGKSTKRIALDTGHQTAAGGGDGIDGDDETSEMTTATWDTTASYSAPTPGQVPTALLP